MGRPGVGCRHVGRVSALAAVKRAVCRISRHCFDGCLRRVERATCVAHMTQSWNRGKESAQDERTNSEHPHTLQPEHAGRKATLGIESVLDPSHRGHSAVAVKIANELQLDGVPSDTVLGARTSAPVNGGAADG